MKLLERVGRRPDVAAFAVVLIGGALVFTVPRFGVPQVAAGFNPSDLPVAAGSELLQTFEVRARGTQAVALRLADAADAATVHITLEPQAGAGTAAPLVSASAGPNLSSRWLEIEFPPLPHPREARFALRLRVAGPTDATVTFRTTEGHVYRAGDLQLDGEPIPLDLVMRVDAQTAQPWRALSSMLRARTGVPGLEWIIATGYLGGFWLLVRALAPPPPLAPPRAD